MKKVSRGRRPFSPGLHDEKGDFYAGRYRRFYSGLHDEKGVQTRMETVTDTVWKKSSCLEIEAHSPFLP
jgi:hypothetical protein